MAENLNIGVVFEAVNNATGVITQLKSEIAGLQNAVNINTRGIDTLTTSLGNAGNAARGAGEAASGGKSGFESMLSSFNRISASAFIVFETLKHVAEAIYELITTEQQMALQLSFVEGGMAASREEMERMRGMFEHLHVNMPQVTNDFVQLREAGLSMEQANNVLHGTAVAASVLGGGQQMIDRVTTSLSTLATRGVASGREFTTLLRSMPGVLAQMATDAHTSMSAFEEAINHGTMSAESIIDRFSQAVLEKFGPVQRMLAFTLSGAMADFGHMWQDHMDHIVNGGTANAFTQMVMGMSDAVDRMMTTLEQDGTIHRMQQGWSDLGVAMEPVIFLFQAFWRVMTPIWNLIGDIIHLISAFTQHLFDMISQMSVGDSIIHAIGDALNFVGGMIHQADEFIKGLTASLDHMHAAAMRAGTGVGNPTAGNRPFVDSRLDTDPIDAARLAGGIGHGYSPQGESAARRLAALAAQIHAEFLAGGLAFVQKLEEAQHKMEAIAHTAFSAQAAAADAIAGLAHGLTPQQIAEAAGSNSTNVRTRMAAEIEGTFARAYQEYQATLTNALLDTQQKIDQARGQIAGTDVASAVERVQHQWAAVLNTLDQELQKENDLNRVTHAEDAQVAHILELRNQIKQNMELFLERAKLAAQYARQEADASERTVLANLQRQQVMNAIHNSTNPLVQGISATPGGQNFEQALQEQSRLASEIQDFTAKMNAATLQAQTGPENMRAIAQQQADIYRSMIANDQTAMKSMSAAAIAQRTLWQSVANTISSSLTNAIMGLVTGTQTLRDVAVSAFNDITHAVVQYIEQLIEAQIQQMILNALKAAGMFLADGGIVGGPVKAIPKMADGGLSNGSLITGPTMFLAGEAGTEAIMPLSKVGGKLGVRSTGGSGDYHIHVHAIDTRAGAQFLMDNMDHIVSGLRQRNSQNRGVDRYRP